MCGEIGVVADQQGRDVSGLRDHFLVAQHVQQPQAGPAAGLGGAEHVALAALLEVDARELEAVVRRRDCIEPLTGRAALCSGRYQQAQARVAAAADTAAQLVELRDSESVGVEDHHHRRVGDVDPDLDHRGRDQHVDVAGSERAHHLVLAVGRHPSVQHLHTQPVERAVGEHRGDLLDRRHRRRVIGLQLRVVALAVAPIRGQTTYTWWPLSTSSRIRVPRRARARPAVRRAEPRWSASPADRRAARPASTSRGRRTPSSRPCAGSAWRSSPARAGVSSSLFAVRAARCSTPKRCCSSTTTRPRSTNCTFSSSSACVPITMPADPEAASSIAARRAAAPSEPVSSTTCVASSAPPSMPPCAELAEHLGDRAVVLLREHLGRREKCRLTSGVDDAEHRAQRDDGLAGADLALQQPVHRVARREVVEDHSGDLLLPGRQLERQPLVEPLEQSAVAAGARSGVASRAVRRVAARARSG